MPLPTTDPIPQTLDPTHLLLSLKSNLTQPSPILAFTLNETIHWQNTPYSLPLADSQKPKSKIPDPKDDSLLAESIDFLNTLLAEGPSQARHILTSATHNGINHRTLRRAKSHLHIHCQWSPPWKAWFWSLPGDKRPLPKTEEQRRQEKDKKIMAASTTSEVIALMQEWDKEL